MVDLFVMKGSFGSSIVDTSCLFAFDEVIDRLNLEICFKIESVRV